MKILSIELFGEYKGLKDQVFDFSSAAGNVIVFIGANGSGKSQVMELIAEVFAYLERKRRSDFRVRDRLGYDFRVVYQLKSPRFEEPRRYVIDSRVGMQVEIHGPDHNPVGPNESSASGAWRPLWTGGDLEDVQLPRLVGYASGLSENLQRAFMKNALQFHDVIRARARLKEELAQPNVDEEGTIAINSRYLRRHPGIFSPEHDGDKTNLFRLRETDTAVPRSLFLDYDCAALLIMLLGLLPAEDRNSIWGEVPFRHPARAIIRFDLRSQTTTADNARDIQRLIELAGDGRLSPISPQTTPEQYELLQLDYLAGDIELNFTDERFVARLSDSTRDPSQWFFALYKLQLLGVAEWTGNVKKSLRRDSFQGHVEKPLKGKLPLSVQELWMSDGRSQVTLDDLSDGEVQLLLTLGAVRLFGDDETLFLYDEPETHLNPSWRARFHLDFEKANRANGSAQAMVSSHSPFLVSSLPREAIFHFEKSDGATTMSTPPSETFGASFDVLIKKHFNLRATISETAIQEIREKLASPELTTQQKIAWLEQSVGESMERSYLIHKLRSE
ncbi:AAA family ATPase [Burkholderia gladioli]|uniref:AAA family ATPase n=1 Tax=Burkholderia gladioli TaxID=28095 RepID=UPI001640812C|nr:AAA family ATPase [Burkholderia gladioli]